jgi:hypothetical protein
VSRHVPNGWKWSDWGEVVADLCGAYGELERPSRKFVLQQARLEMYEAEIASLAAQFPIRSEVEPNDSVCLTVEIPGSRESFLFLSLVGRYYYVDARSETGLEVDLDFRSGFAPEVRRASAILTRLGLLNVNREMLIADAPIKLPGIDKPTVFHALFFPEGDVDLYLA